MWIGFGEFLSVSWFDFIEIINDLSVGEVILWVEFFMDFCRERVKGKEKEKEIKIKVVKEGIVL